MRYLGNKTKLLSFIDAVIDKYEIEGEIFADIFSGTCAVGDFFKGKYTVYSNDFLYYSFIFSQAKLLNNMTPKFDVFKEKLGSDIFEWLNSQKHTKSGHGFIYNNYTPAGDRMFFTEETGIRIDGIRLHIEELYKDKLLNEPVKWSSKIGHSFVA